MSSGRNLACPYPKPSFCLCEMGIITVSCCMGQVRTQGLLMLGPVVNCPWVQDLGLLKTQAEILTDNCLSL